MKYWRSFAGLNQAMNHMAYFFNSDRKNWCRADLAGYRSTVLEFPPVDTPNMLQLLQYLIMPFLRYTGVNEHDVLQFQTVTGLQLPHRE
jgi:hypothetical protein